MAEHKLLKRIAAGLLSTAFLIGWLPTGSGGLLAKEQALTAGAAESYLGNPAAAWESCTMNENTTIVADVSAISGSTIKIGDEKNCGITIKGNLDVGQNTKIYLYNGSYLFITGKLDLYAGCQIVCEDNAKIVLKNQNIAAHGNVSISESDFVITGADTVWSSQDLNSSQSFDEYVSVADGSTVNIGNTGKCCVTFNGDLDIRGKFHVCDGSYVVVYGKIWLGPNSDVTCDGNAKIIGYSTSNLVPLTVSQTASFDVNDFAGTNLKNLVYIPDYIPSKDYFSSGGEYYTFNGEAFTKVKDNAKTLALKEICTENSSGFRCSPAMKQAYAEATSSGNLTKGLRAYTVDGETCDEMYLVPKQYPKDQFINLYPLLLVNYQNIVNNGTAYFITEEEAEEIAGALNAPRFNSVNMLTGINLTLYMALDTDSADTLSDYSVVVSGKCFEDGQHQQITYNDSLKLYTVSATVPVTDFDEQLTFSLYWKDKKVGTDYTTSVESYLQTASELKPSVKDFCDSILFYGKTSANFFSDKGYDIASDVAAYKSRLGLTSESIDDTLSDCKPNYTPDQAKLSLVLGTQTSLRFYINGMPENLSFSYGGTEYTTVKDSNGVYFELTGFRPYDMVNRNYDVTVGGTKYHFGCCTWVYRVLTDTELSQIENLPELAVGIYAYAKSGYDLLKSLAGN